MKNENIKISFSKNSFDTKEPISSEKKDSLKEKSKLTKETKPKKENFFLEIIKFSLFTLIIVLPFRLYIAEPFIVEGKSMSPTFETGDYLIIDQISYRLSEPERGEIIVFKYPNNPSRYFIKRIIGLPDETVILNDGKITIKNERFPNGFSWKESYVKNISHKNMTYTLSDDEYFVMGDNRANSSDSRIWGPVDKKFLVGKVFIRLFPFTEIGLFPGQFLLE